MTIELTFVKDSPLVFDFNITVYLLTRNMKSFTCFVSNVGMVDCKCEFAH